MEGIKNPCNIPSYWLVKNGISIMSYHNFNNPYITGYRVHPLYIANLLAGSMGHCSYDSQTKPSYVPLYLLFDRDPSNGL